MRIRPLGWELTTFLVLVTVVALGLLARADWLVMAALWGCQVAFVAILASLAVQLVVRPVRSRRNRAARGSHPVA